MGKIIYREGAKEREGRQKQKGFAVIQDLQDFLRDSFADSLSGHYSFVGHGGSKVFIPAYPGLKSRDRNPSCKKSLQPS
jgi:hypothetical protein